MKIRRKKTIKIEKKKKKEQNYVPLYYLSSLKLTQRPKKSSIFSDELKA